MPDVVLSVTLSASWSRKDEMKEVATQLRSMDLFVTSHWMYENDWSVSGFSHEKYRRAVAFQDVNDIKQCDFFVRFSDDLSPVLVPSSLATGGRMFETGIAYALGKTVVIVGGKQNVFDYLPNIVHVKDTPALLRYLSPVEVN